MGTNEDEEVVVAASLNNASFADGYAVEKDAPAIPEGEWKEVFNSDAASYGGTTWGMKGAPLRLPTAAST